MESRRFSLQFIGTGNAWSKWPENFNTNVLVRSGGMRWLIDCGVLCPAGLHALGLTPLDVDAVYISHLHGDHVLGLEEVLLRNYFCARRRTGLYLPEELFSRYSHIDGADIWENCLRAALETPDEARDPERLLTLEDFAEVHLLRAGCAAEIGGLGVEIFPVRHLKNRPCFGIILGGRVAYTSDCTFSRARIEWLLGRGVDTIFHDVCFLAPGQSNCVHASFEELATLSEAVSRHIVLMHYADGLCSGVRERALGRGFRFAHRGEIFEF